MALPASPIPTVSQYGLSQVSRGRSGQRGWGEAMVMFGPKLSGLPRIPDYQVPDYQVPDYRVPDYREATVVEYCTDSREMRHLSVASSASLHQNVEQFCLLACGFTCDVASPVDTYQKSSRKRSASIRKAFHSLPKHA